ncbi:unnamed protein product, partial [Rhizoctonia solani]
ARQPGAKPRILVLCFDGTTNVYDDTNTGSTTHSLPLVNQASGTYVPPGLLLPITPRLAKIADQAIALYLNKHVMGPGGYEFLMNHYNDGDKICE